MIKTIHYISALVVPLVAILALEVETLATPKAGIKPQHHLVKQVTLSFSGDVIQHMPQVSAARLADGSLDFSGNFAHIDTVWQSVDFSVINYETTVSANGRYTGFPRFSAPPDVAYALRQAGITTIALANNHCCDKGRAGIEKTISTLDSVGFHTVGVYRDSASSREILMLNKGDFRIAMLNFTYDTNGMPIPKGVVVNEIDTMKMREIIARARIDSVATHVIAFMHWGVEYQRRASHRQRATGLWLRENGVDVVVGSHPHVVQEIDTINNIAYSLGNFISNQQDQYTDSGITVKVTLEKTGKPRLEYIPHWCDKFAERGKRYRVLTERDTVLLRGENLSRMQRALNEAREAVGSATELKISL